MTRTRLVQGTITEKTKGNEVYFAQGNIVVNAGKKINITSSEGVSFGAPESPPERKEEDVIKREIYLTFDDGIQAGTAEVLKVLKETGVKATFFLTGIHLWYAFKYFRETATEVLKDIYENHIIGNHSFSHANDHYSSFYRNGGVKIDNNSNRLSVEDDFEKNKNQINYFLELIGKGVTNNSFPFSQSQNTPFARFPGTNTWYVNDNLKDIKRTSRGETFTFGVKDTEEEATFLYNKGYKIFGWDVEWEMSFNFHNDSLALEGKRISEGNMDFSNWEISHPFFDMYSGENINKDRVNKNWLSVRDEILDYAYNNPYTPIDNVAKTEGKVVVLMHERAFRKGKKTTNGTVDLNDFTEANKLKDLIAYFKNIKAEFKTLDQY
ncbi:polysaccharide deacetylase family protein [Flavobacterium sp. J27]|uniref:polysaccharide deacetylase family protein n=1 Tax=Flavobacterium sp. J27 TaxID=2060419 RepID=UPI00102F3FF9|nr:polysaccharide deacetylase family protein [Flavobacterium sp. J27]